MSQGPNPAPGLERLLQRLHPEREGAAEAYVSQRARLVSFFAWREQAAPDECADEVIDRVMRKLESGEEISDVPSYMIGVARMVLLEFQRGQRTHQRVLQMAAPISGGPAHGMEEEIDARRRGACLRRCLAGLPPESRQLVIDYYTGEQRAKIETRKRLAERLGLGLGALRIRMLRLRERLEECLTGCLRKGEGALP